MARNQAIVIGINQYEFLQPLRYAKQDALAMQRFLLEEAQFDRVFLFTDDSLEIGGKSTRPSRANLRRVFRELFETPFLGDGDNFWFFFGGHGMRSGERDYLMPIDGDPYDVENTGISINFISEKLRQCGADNVVLMLDACRNVATRAGEGIGNQAAENARQTGVISLFACSPNQFSYELEAISQGAFTKAVLEGLGMQGRCSTVERLSHYLEHRVPELVRQYYPRANQTPYTIAEPITKSHLVLIPRHATLQDAETLKKDAFKAEIKENYRLAKQLWIRVLTVSPADLEAIESIERLALKSRNVFVSLPTSPLSMMQSRSATPEMLQTVLSVTQPHSAIPTLLTFEFDVVTVLPDITKLEAGDQTAIESLVASCIPEPTDSTQANLEELWQEILNNLQPFGTQALLKQQGSLLSFDGEEAQIGIESAQLLNMAQGRSKNIRNAFLKTFNKEIKFTLVVAPSNVLPLESDIAEPTDSGSTQANLEELWQDIVKNLQPFGTQALLKQQGSLLSFDGEEAQIGIESAQLLNMAQGRSKNIRDALLKTFNKEIKFTLVVAPTNRVSLEPSIAESANSTQANLEELWQEILNNLQPFGTQALLKQQGSLLSFDGEEAQIGIESAQLLNMAQGRSKNIRNAFLKTFNKEIKFTLVVAPTQELTSDHLETAQNVETSDSEELLHKSGCSGHKKEIVTRVYQSRAEYFTEDFIKLNMISIPGGSFQMGASEGEEGAFSYEYPKHLVTIPPFFMSKFPITQAQWKAVSQLPKVHHDLNPNPSRFKGENHPVGKVSWYDAIEFCDRLSYKTGKPYRLPSEAEWEYACRAGTTTPFHFGETITTDLANYRGTDWEYQETVYSGSYGEAPKGIYRKQTTEVGSFPSNAFGLYDMHGNVWEWCLDHWHENYDQAPIDGSSWLSNDDNAPRLLRGGSCLYPPLFCRSAFRDCNQPEVRHLSIGFRCVCSSLTTS